MQSATTQSPPLAANLRIPAAITTALLVVGPGVSVFLALPGTFWAAVGIDDASFHGVLGGLMILDLAAFFLTIAPFLVWMYRAAANLGELRPGAITMSPSACVGWWFVPVASLVMPFRAMKQVYLASVASPTTGLLPIWWTLWIVSRYADYFGGRSVVDTASVGAVVVAALSVGAGITCVAIIRQVSAGQLELQEDHRRTVSLASEVGHVTSQR